MKNFANNLVKQVLILQYQIFYYFSLEHILVLSVKVGITSR